MIWHRLRSDEIDHELIWLSVSLLAVVGACAWILLRLPWPGCIFHAVTGLPCLTCGGTRCAIALAHGNFLRAFSSNPLIFSAAVFAGLFNIYAAVVLTARLPRLRLPPLPQNMARWLRSAGLLVLAGNWLYLVLFLG
jgi:hypothetical protein